MNLPYRAICDQVAGQVFGMIVYFVFRSTIGKGRDIGIIAIHEDSYALFLERLRQEVRRPEYVWLAAGPGVKGMAVESVDEDDTAACQPRNSIKIVVMGRLLHQR